MPDLALDLLMCDNYGECCAMAEALEDVNNQRRAIEAELSDIAKEAGRQDLPRGSGRLSWPARAGTRA